MKQPKANATYFRVFRHPEFETNLLYSAEIHKTRTKSVRILSYCNVEVTAKLEKLERFDILFTGNQIFHLCVFA